MVWCVHALVGGRPILDLGNCRGDALATAGKKATSLARRDMCLEFGRATWDKGLVRLMRSDEGAWLILLIV